MKKIMIAVAAIAVAAMTQAASFNWKATGSTTKGYFYDATGAKITSSMTSYLFDSAVLSQADLLTSLRSGGSISSLESVTQSTIASSKMAAKAFDYGTVGNDYGFYMVVIDGDNALVSDLISASAQAADTSDVSFANPGTWSKNAFSGADTSFSSAGWYSTSSVPEPTSGLLLLLGMAGLALKRKHA